MYEPEKWNIVAMDEMTKDPQKHQIGEDLPALPRQLDALSHIHDLSTRSWNDDGEVRS